MERFDIVIAHRVCPALSKTAVGFSDKRKMVEATTSSLRDALEGVSARLIVILDGCDDYESIFRDAFAQCKNVELCFERYQGIGNQATYGRQIELLAGVDDSDCVCFSEDDYLYRKNAFKAMLHYMQRPGVDLITPIDHPDRYNCVLERPRPVRLSVTRDCHWREVGSSCLTFLVRTAVLKSCRRVFESYVHSTEEATMWLGLTKEGVFDVFRLAWAAIRHFVFRRNVPFGQVMALCTWKRQRLNLLRHRRCALWAPIPTLAVHLSSVSLALHSEDFFETGREDVRLTLERYLAV